MARGENHPNDRLRTALKTRGISESRISFDLRIGRSTLNRIAVGWDVPGDQLKSRIAAYLGVAIVDLWPEKEGA
jgi:ribosome-binding protein aMBF1 (putative translation factor)